MNIVEKSGLSYGKVYRIFNGSIEKPTPNSLKQLAKALQLDYSYLFQKAGYIHKETKPSQTKTSLIPILSWDFCYLAFPFQEPLSAGLSDEHIPYHRNIKDGFAISVDSKHSLFPYFCCSDTLICEPHCTPKENDIVIFINTQTNQFNYGLYKKNKNNPYISSLHQQDTADIILNESLQDIILGTIISHMKS
tara:strand:- start:362 stop:937 length:576 start_codon:yes stop_codon:yes gene_type:complete